MILGQLIETRYNSPSKRHPQGSFSAKILSSGMKHLDKKKRVKIDYRDANDDGFQDGFKEVLVKLLVEMDDIHSHWTPVGRIDNAIIWARNGDMGEPVRVVVNEPILYHKLGINKHPLPA